MKVDIFSDPWGILSKNNNTAITRKIQYKIDFPSKLIEFYLNLFLSKLINQLIKTEKWIAQKFLLNSPNLIFPA